MNRISTCILGGVLLAVGSTVPAANAKTTAPHPRLQSPGGVNSPNIPGSDALLWDQVGPTINNVVDQEFSDFPSFSAFVVDDFSTGGQTWNISSVSTFFTQRPGLGFWDASITSGKLQFYPKSGSLPSNGSDIAPEYTVTVALTNLGGTGWQVTADTSGVGELQGINGDYWVGLTPSASFVQYGQEFHLLQAPVFGDQAALRNPGGAFGQGANWITAATVIGGGPYDMNFRLEGTVVPAPGAAALLGLGGLLGARRRR